MQKINRKIILFSITLIFLLCLTSVSAEDLDEKNMSSTHDTESIEYTQDYDMTNIEDNSIDNVLYSTSSSKNIKLPIKNKEKVKDSKKISIDDLNESEDYIHRINSDNLDSYFNNGVLKDEFKDSILVFNGEFVNKGIITINSPNIQIIGNNTLFKNTGFCLDSPNILLSDFNFILNQEFYDNDYAGILVLQDNNTIYNCNINYTVPDDCSGFCVYCEGASDAKINGFKLINNTFNFIANNLNKGWDYPIFLDYVDNAITYGNKINALLPLRDVDWSQEIFMGARMDKVGALVANNCENLTILNNHITSQVTSKIDTDESPTLDTVLIYACNNSLIENNYIYSEDYYTPEGTANYLYGLDLYTSNNVDIIGNQIHIRTTGGTEIRSTAYPIQVTGPSTDIHIAYNNLTSVNNGPNLGIYSHNFYGATKIHIISNFINITGRANTDNWALVSGIEVQDSNDLIWNNTIIVTNLGEYADKNNIYGISYSQNTNYNHTYNIQYNTVITNGNYAVLLSGAYSLVTDSIIANNILNTYMNSGDDAVYIGKGSNNNVFDNTGTEFMDTLDNNDLPDWLKKHETPTVSQPTITKPTANLNENSETPKPSDDEGNIVPTPPIIKPEHTDENSNGSGTTNDSGNGAMPWNKTGNNSGLNTNDTGNNESQNSISNETNNPTESNTDTSNNSEQENKTETGHSETNTDTSTTEDRNNSENQKINTEQLSNLEQLHDLEKLRNTENQNITNLDQRKDNPINTVTNPDTQTNTKELGDNPSNTKNTKTKEDINHDKSSSKSIALKVGGKSSKRKTHSIPSDTGSSAANSKTYEVKEKTKKIIKENPFPAAIISVLLLLLIFVGYKHKSKEEEY